MLIWPSIEQHVEFLGGIAVTLIGFFAVRFIKKARVTESLTRKNLLLDLRQKMSSQKIAGEQLAAIERDFERLDHLRSIEDRVIAESYDFGVTEIEEATCQQDMNRAQARRLAMLNAKLIAIISELTSYLDVEDKSKLKAVQRAWEKYRTEQADWAARIWTNGSMAPFAHSGEASQITVERIAALETELDAERSLYARGLRDA